MDAIKMITCGCGHDVAAAVLKDNSSDLCPVCRRIKEARDEEKAYSLPTFSRGPLFLRHCLLSALREVIPAPALMSWAKDKDETYFYTINTLPAETVLAIVRKETRHA